MKSLTSSLLLVSLAGCLDVATTDTTSQDSFVPVGGWTYDHGIVKYHVTAAFAGNAGAMAALNSTIAEYQNTTGLTFVSQASASAPGIIYDLNTAAGCGGGQTGNRDNTNVPLGPRVSICSTNRNTVAHETGHALGMWHEQQRSDRDLYVKCHDNWIDPTLECAANDANCQAHVCTLGGDFAIYAGSAPMVYAPYDLLSIMQYYGFNFAKDASHVSITVNDGGTCDGETGSCLPDHTDLSIEDINTVRQMYQLPLGGDDAGVKYGTAIAVGDFDKDGYMDVAVGAPDSVQDGKTVGAVYLYKGTFGAHSLTGNQVGASDWRSSLVPWKKIVPATLNKTGQDGERFGAALHAVDLDGDGVLDLAIGAPGRDTGTGAVYVMYGRAFAQPYDWGNGTIAMTFGLQPSSAIGAATYYPESTFGVANVGDHFGAAVMGGDFDKDGRRELAIGAPDRSTGGQVALTAQPVAGSLVAGTWIAPSAPYPNSKFGTSIATHDFDGDGKSDVIVGAPKAGSTNGGAMYVFGSLGHFAQQQGHMMSAEVSGDDYGQALAIGDYLGTGTWQLAVGSPGRGGSGRVELMGWIGSSFAQIQIVDQSIAGQANATGDRFGAALRTAHLHAGTRDDLVVGAPDKAGRTANAGMAFTFTSNGSTFTAGKTHLPQATGSHFGCAFGDGDLDRDGGDDLVIGATDEIGTSEVNPSGVITVEQGSRSGLTGQYFLRYPAFESGPYVLID